MFRLEASSSYYGVFFPSKKEHIEKSTENALIRKFSTEIPDDWSKFKEAISLTFEWLGQVFAKASQILHLSKKTPWTDSQETPTTLIAIHEGPKGEKIGREIVKRHEGITDLIASKEAKLESLGEGSEKSALKTEIDNLKNYSKDDKWATANRVRDEGKAYQKSKTGNPPQQTYIPALVNNRTHTIEYRGKERGEFVSINRSGALSNLSDGSCNLRELKKNLEDKSGQFDEKDIQEKFNQRHSYIEDQMVQYLKGQVIAFADKIKDPNSAVGKLNALQITQVSLLNPNNAKEQEGIVINEGNQMLDMDAIFEEFNGKEIEFTEDKGVTAPFIKEGRVIMPISLLGELSVDRKNELIAKPLRLSCTFFNCSVQGSKSNLDAQTSINEKGIQNLQRNIEELKNKGFIVDDQKKQLDAIAERFKAGESSYEIARDLILLQKELGGVTGANCYSGKDRTGYLLMLITNHFLSKSIDNNKNIVGLDKNIAKRKLRNDLRSTFGIASEVARQNTGFKFLKVQKEDLMGTSEYGLIGIFFRLAYGLNAWFAKS